jgi:hypothetical protein
MFSTVALLSTPALAQEEGPPCAPFDQVEARLAAEFMETRVAQGVTSSGQAMLVIFASPNGETWTAVMVRPGGLACMAAAGMDWQARSDPAPVPETGL